MAYNTELLTQAMKQHRQMPSARQAPPSRPYTLPVLNLENNEGLT